MSAPNRAPAAVVGVLSALVGVVALLAVLGAPTAAAAATTPTAATPTAATPTAATPAAVTPAAVTPAAVTGTAGPADSAGFAGISGCISGAEHLLAAVVVDESLSLRNSDPRALRVRGIVTAVDALQQLAAADPDLNVQVSLSTFAARHRTLQPWRQLSADTATTLRATAQRVLPGRDAGNATDYRAALLGARNTLDARAAGLGDPQACKLVLWFTDGALDVDHLTDTAARQLCQRGGIVDALRRDGIGVVALALFTPGSGVTVAQRNQLRAIAEGTAAGTSCGSVPLATDSTAGVFLPAADAAALQRLFATAGALLAGGTEVDTRACPGPGCRSGSIPVTVDPGVAGVRVLVEGSGGPLGLTTPSGRTLRLTHGTAVHRDATTISYLSRDGLGTLNLDYTATSTTRSRWLLTPAGQARVSTYWFWGAQLVPATVTARAGGPVRLAFTLRDRAGNPLPVHLYRHLSARVTAAGKPLPVRVDGDGRLSARTRLGADHGAGVLPVAAMVTATTTGGVRLGPVSSTSTVDVTLPPAFPQVAPGELDFGDIDGAGTAAASLRLTGSRLGPTRVCLRGATLALPGSDPRPGLLRTDADCVDLDRAQQDTLGLTLTTRTAADGLATGRLRLALTGAGEAGTIERTVPVLLAMHRPVDQQARWSALALLLALAAVIPLLVLMGGNAWLGRFTRRPTARTATVPVSITRHGLGDLTPPDTADFGVEGSLRRGRRMLITATGITVRARGLLREPVGVATTAPGKVLVSALPPHRGALARHAPVGLGEVDATFVVVDPAGASAEQATGTLVMAVPVQVDRQGLADRIARLQRGVDWERVLADAAGTATSPATGTDADTGATVLTGPPWDDSGTDGSRPLQPEWARTAAPTAPAAPAAGRRRWRWPGRRNRPSTRSATSTAAPAVSDLPPLPELWK